jgi:DNA primase
MDQDEFRGEVIFTFDGDEAGRKAALRAFQDDQRFVTQTFVAVQGDGLDPCDVRLQHGDAAVRDLVARRVPMFEFAIRSVLSSYDLESAEGRTAARRATMGVVRDIRDVSLRTEYARRLAGWLGVADPNDLVSEARGDVIDVRRGTRSAAAQQPDPRDPAVQVEREAVKLAVQRPALVGPLFDALEPGAFTAPAYALVRDIVVQAGGTTNAIGGEAWVGALLEQAPDDEARSLLTELAVEQVRETTDDDPRYAGAVLARLRELHATRLIVELKSRLQRLNPVEEVENYNRMFGELVALEQHRRGLREQGLDGL